MNPQPRVEEEYRSRFGEDGGRDVVSEAALKELVLTMHGLAVNKPGEFKERIDAFEGVLERLDSRVYGEILENGHEYSICVEHDAERMIEAADATRVDGSGSCIAEEGLDFSRSKFGEYASDPFTIWQNVERDGELVGYTRNFLVETEDKVILAADAFEVPQKDFAEYTDVVKAMGMASIQLGLDLGVDGIVGSDARVKYGPRQAYGSTGTTLQGYEKPGAEVYSYEFATGGRTNGSAHVLMENWHSF